MFTPPPSPRPPIWRASHEWHSGPSAVCQTQHDATNDPQILLSRQRFYTSIRWTVIFVPLSLMVFAAYTRFWTHPAVFDLLATDGDSGRIKWASLADWSLHGPHRSASNHFVGRSVSNHLVARSSSTPAPTVPINPTLPTPFPQPFDTTLSANFSTTSCYDFFLNMTDVDAFRSCRPFSFLVSTSSAFVEAETDINSINTDVWGTCSTETPLEQCDDNMSWFASSLQEACQTDLENRVATAELALNALRTYDVMRSVGCQVDLATNAYCFVEAVANSDQSNYWFYLLPLGQILVPNITTSACNDCTKGLMASYASALNGTSGTTLQALAQTYNAAADTLNNLCGPSYAKTQVTSSRSSAWVNAGAPGTGSLMVLGALVSLVGMLC